MTAYSSIKSAIERFLVGVDVQIADSLYWDGVCGGLDAILPWQAKRSTQTLTGDGTDVDFTLAADLYEIDAIMLDDTGKFIPQAMLSPNLYHGDNMDGDNDWIEYPKGTLLLSKAIDSGDTATVFYRAYWDKPASYTDDSFTLTIPAFLEKPLIYWASAYVITSQSITTSVVRQFGTSVDSGNPLHNPLEQSAKFLLAQFADMMNSHPRQVAGSRV